MECAVFPRFANAKESDRLALLDFKNSVTQDSVKIMNSWNDSIPLCNWIGVTCNPHSGRVVVLNLENQKLIGSIPPAIGNLTFLTGINLGENVFHCDVPEEIGRLLRLQHLNLTHNSFSGKIPTNLTHCTHLRVTTLLEESLLGSLVSDAQNQLHGQPPPDIGLTLPNLRVFAGGLINFTGPIPVSLSNASGLQIIDFANKSLTGTTPRNLRSLAVLGLAGNRFGKELPSSIANLSNQLQRLTLGENLIHGGIPIGIGNLVSLSILGLENNYFTRCVPTFIGKLQKLEELDLEVEVGQLDRHEKLDLANNKLSGEIPSSLASCTNLDSLHLEEQYLNLSYNDFVGEVSQEGIFANASAIFLSGNSKLCGGVSQLHLPPCSSFSSGKRLTLIVISVFVGNNLTGRITAWIGNLSSLNSLLLAMNNLQGSMPYELGQLSGLENFQVCENHLSGKVPTSIYNISSIQFVSFAQNQLHGQLPPDIGLTLPNLLVFAGGLINFTGPIPVSLSNASGLQIIDFANNSLTGTTPRNLGSLAVLGLAGNRFGEELPSSTANLSNQLQRLTLGENLIHGGITIGIGNLVSLSILGLENNYFTRSVPTFIGKLQKLEELDLEGNRFSRSIPSSLGNLTLPVGLYLHDNRFEGSIPSSLGNCQKLLALNLSSNNLSGTILNSQQPSQLY
ncbi:LRR receptor-like serine/threonine-protein kinase FLS2 [Durio zibethinus]|uniref:LRR receptor-like serine/threonine-protein kinase FLS2 n=1 Tax=Durio zibethinus TaxID=66656 RepID=A0A6P6ALV9_DURZI|nr:LRR receptor-like serine/threonine-protein kinase FLS2 [Durio zibethinus]